MRVTRPGALPDAIGAPRGRRDQGGSRGGFGADAVVRLFGSRVDDDKRGGDIDLHVEVAGAEQGAGEIAFRVALFDRLDEEPVDVVVHRIGTEPRWIDEIAYRDGIVL